MLSRLEREDGVAMVTAILVSAIVMMLAMTAVATSIHNTDASGYDKRRLMAIDSAEAGIDAYYSLLNTKGFAQIPTETTVGTCVLSQELTTSPASSYTVTPTFYAVSPDTVPAPTGFACPQTSPRSTYVELESVGQVGQSAPLRTMHSRARLTLIVSSFSFPASALYGATSIDLSANVSVLGTGATNADVYSNGPVNVSTSSNIKGNMYVQGTATIANGNFQLSGDLWANGNVTVSGGKIGGTAISSTGSVAVSGNSTVMTGAKAKLSITRQNPAKIFGTQSPNTPGIPAPPSFTYPTYTFAAADWQPGLVYINGCSNAVTEITNWTTGNKFIRLTGCTTFNPPTKVLPGHLAILTDGGVTFTTNTKFTTTTGTSASPLSAFIFTGMTGSCGDFLSQSNSGIGTNINVMIFTPQSCKAEIQSNSWSASGQIFSGTVKFSSNATLTYAPVERSWDADAQNSSPSLVDIVYKREVSSA